MILDRPIVAASFVAQGACNPTLAEPGCSCNEQVLIAVDPVADDESGEDRAVDAACRRGILIKARSVASIRSILKNGLDRAFLDETLDHQPLRHGNIRGQGYFH